MTRRTGTSSRARALAQAAEAVARRDMERIAREKRLQAALADFYHAQAEVERIREAAETAAAPFEASIRQAVHTLDSLGETRTGIVALTGLSLPRVRECLADRDVSAPVPAAPHAEALADRSCLARDATPRATPPVETAVRGR